jgi:hypothetical protein
MLPHEGPIMWMQILGVGQVVVAVVAIMAAYVAWRTSR